MGKTWPAGTSSASRPSGARGENSAVYLAWNEAGAAEYTLNLPAAGFTAGARDALIFNLADANQDKAPEKPGGPTIGAPAEQAMPAPDPAGANPEEPRAARDAPRPPLDLTVLLEDAAGHTSALPLSRYLLVQPQLSARLYKAGLFEPAREPNRLCKVTRCRWRTSWR